ncbi:MAG: tetratricopeptide repeat protein [Planctomycetes bacterium]|nr:tetratricopeptide repeat protein [Planctomycetota bacterium]
MNELNKRYKLLSIFLTLLLGWSSIGWIDPLADKIREGNRLYLDGNYDGALDEYVNAQIDSPEMPQLDFNIADVQYKRGKYNEAAQLFEKTIKSDDRVMKAKSSFNMGNTMYRQGKMKEALECYKKTVDCINETISTPGELDALKNDAKYNYEFVDKKMKEQQQQQKQQNQDQKDQQQKEDQDKKDEQSGENKGEDKEKQKPQQDKQQPAPENKQEKNENEKDENHSQSDKDKQKDQPSEQQQQRPQEMKQMSKEEAERLLDALNQSEKEARATVRDTQHSQHKSVEKDW